MSTGVIVGRFQVDSLHDGHKKIIDQALLKNGKVIIFIGRHCNNLIVTRNNPLDYWSTVNVIREEYEDDRIVTAPLFDNPCDKVWSDELDNHILQMSPKDTIGGNVTLYGGEDSFLKRYHGKFNKQVVEMHVKDNILIHSSLVRAKIGKTPVDSSDFRRGIIYATQNMRDNVLLPTVDVAIYSREKDSFLMQTRKGSTKIGLIGGYIEKGDSNAQSGAEREVFEETALSPDHVNYYNLIDQLSVSDWREAENTSCMTTLFVAKYIYGPFKPGDDIKGGSLKWYEVKHLKCFDKEHFQGDHCKLFNLVADWINLNPHWMSNADA